MTLKRRDEKPTRKWKHAADGADAARLSLGGGRGGHNLKDILTGLF